MNTESTADHEEFAAPHPGSQSMPRWDTGELVDAPRFTYRNWFALLGPGLVMGGAAIGGGEWLLGPLVTARYGGSLLWLATLSILGQVIYNIEISRYTLYCGEPIFNGKFRTAPGPRFWLLTYLLLDMGAIFPYLAANAATPLATVMLGGRVPQPELNDGDWWLMKVLAYVIFLAALVPLLFGGKVYNSLRRVMTFKIIVVFGFLLILAVGYTHASTWVEITTGLFKFGTLPIERGEDLNGDGKLNPGEDWDQDGNLDVVEPGLPPIVVTALSSGWPDLDGDGQADPPRDTNGDGRPDEWGELTLNGDPVPVTDEDQDGQPDAWPDLNGDGKPDTYIDYDGDGCRDGANVENVFASLAAGRGMPEMDFALLGFIAGLAAIAGSGGLTNTTISNYTRDQGWGMGHHVGAIPSVVGGRQLKLSHAGCVFQITQENLARFRRWYKHVCRDQLAVWMPACFIGLALPSMLSIEYLRRGYESDNWTAAAMTAGGVHARVSEQSGPLLGSIFWFMTLFCGFMVLAPSMATTGDGVIRRWVDVFWTSSPRLRKLDTDKIRKVYFWVLVGYASLGLVMLMFEPGKLVQYSTMVYNVALGFSCWHTLVLNMVLLPKELRPGWFVRIALAATGLFFFSLGTVVILDKVGLLARLMS